MTVKNLEKNEGRVTFVMEVEKEQFEKAIDKVYRKQKNSITVPGFRKGKAPRKIIEGMFGATVFYEDAINELFPALYDEAVADAGIKVVGTPSITNVDYADGPLVLTVSADLYPEVKLGQYKGLEAPKDEPKVTDEDIASELSRIQQRNARISTVERPAQDGDTIVLDFEGFIDGVAFDGGKAEGYSLKLGSGSFIPGFEEACVGLSAGDEKDIDVTFPADYGAAELAGKPAVFKVKVHKVKETILPELDDEFAKDVSEFDTLDEYKADLREKELKSRQDAAESAFKNAALSKAIDNMEVTIPNSMVEKELDLVVEQYAYQIQMSGMSLQQYFQMMGTDANGFRESMRPVAYEQVKSRLLLEKIVEVEGFTVSDEELEDEFNKMAEQYVMEVEKVKEYVDAEDLRRDLGYRKASALIADTAIAVAPEAEKTEEPAAEEKEAPKKTTRKTTTKTTAKKTAEKADPADTASESAEQAEVAAVPAKETPAAKKPAAMKEAAPKADETVPAEDAEPAAEE